VVGAAVRALVEAFLECSEVPLLDIDGRVGAGGVVDVEANNTEVVVGAGAVEGENTRVDGALFKAEKEEPVASLDPPDASGVL
jgi:hypothetical protein